MSSSLSYSWLYYDSNNVLSLVPDSQIPDTVIYLFHDFPMIGNVNYTNTDIDTNSVCLGIRLQYTGTVNNQEINIIYDFDSTNTVQPYAGITFTEQSNKTSVTLSPMIVLKSNVVDFDKNPEENLMYKIKIQGYNKQKSTGVKTIIKTEEIVPYLCIEKDKNSTADFFLPEIQFPSISTDNESTYLNKIVRLGYSFKNKDYPENSIKLIQPLLRIDTRVLSAKQNPSYFSNNIDENPNPDSFIFDLSMLIKENPSLKKENLLIRPAANVFSNKTSSTPWKVYINDENYNKIIVNTSETFEWQRKVVKPGSTILAEDFLEETDNFLNFIRQYLYLLLDRAQKIRNSQIVPTELDLKWLDFDDTGEITISDVLTLLQYITNPETFDMFEQLNVENIKQGKFIFLINNLFNISEILNLFSLALSSYTDIDNVSVSWNQTNLKLKKGQTITNNNFLQVLYDLLNQLSKETKNITYDYLKSNFYTHNSLGVYTYNNIQKGEI